MNIVCIGGGPSGLYFALLMKQQDASHEITVVERNRPYDAYFSPSWTPFQADRGRDFSVIVDGVSV